MRRRHHKAGDHSMCRKSCPDARGPLRIPPVPPGSAENLDPAAALRDLAARLQAAYHADPGNSLLAKELRSTLQLLLPSRDAAVDHEWRELMAEMSRPVPRQPGDWPGDVG
jgi:hypothetical protein